MPKLSDLNPKSIQLVSRAEPAELPEDTLSLGDVAAMVGQGATFKLGDELLGALKAAKDVALTEKELGDLPELYRQYQKEEEAKYEDLVQAHPKTALAAELAGGFLLPGGFLAKGAKTALTGAKDASMLIKALKAAKEGGIMGAKAGALAGLGGSKSDVSDIKALGKDVLSGAIGGGLIGGGLGATASGVSSVISSLPENVKKIGPLGENLVASFEKNRQGQGFILPEAAERITSETEKAASELTEQLSKASDDVTAQITEHLKTAGDAGAKVNVNANPDLLTNLSQLVKNLQDEGASRIKKPPVDRQKLEIAKKTLNAQLRAKKIDKATHTAQMQALESNPPLQKTALSETQQLLEQEGIDPNQARHQLDTLNDELQRLLKGEMTPQEATNLGKRLSGEYVPNEAPFNIKEELVPSGLGESIKTQAGETADEALGLAGKTQELTTKFKEVRSGVPETVLNKADPIQYADRLINKFANPTEAKTALYNAITKDLIPKLADPVGTADVARNTITELQKRVEILNKKYPDLNLDFNQAIAKLKDASQQRVIRDKLMTKHGEHDTVTGLGKRTLDIAGYGGAGVVGKGVGKVERTMKKFNNYITTASDATLMPIAKGLKSVKGISFLGDALEGAINNKSTSAKNAAIFSIMQNPEARKAVESMISSDEE